MTGSFYINVCDQLTTKDIGLDSIKDVGIFQLTEPSKGRILG
jgi:hypothetical protein